MHSDEVPVPDQDPVDYSSYSDFSYSEKESLTYNSLVGASMGSENGHTLHQHNFSPLHKLAQIHDMDITTINGRSSDAAFRHPVCSMQVDKFGIKYQRST